MYKTVLFNPLLGASDLALDCLISMMVQPDIQALTFIDDGRVGNRRQVSQLVAFPGHNLSQDTPHDLARTCLGEIIDQVLASANITTPQLVPTHNLLRRSKGSNDLSDLQSQLLAQVGLLRTGAVELRLHRDKRVDRLARDVIRAAHHRGLGNTLMQNEG